MIQFIKDLYCGDTISDVTMTILLVIGAIFALLLINIILAGVFG
jgi:hypothetical protein